MIFNRYFMKANYLFISMITSLCLVGCGGENEQNQTNTSQATTTQPPKKTTPVIEVKPLPTKLMISNNNNTLNFGGNGVVNHDNINGKTYYARYGYCYIGCSNVRLGNMHFTLNKQGNNLAINNLVIDKLDEIQINTWGNNIIKPMNTGALSLRTSLLQPVFNYTFNSEKIKTNKYELNLIPAFSTENRLFDTDLTDRVLFSPDGKHLIGLDNGFIFIAQQLDTAPKNWTSDIDNTKISSNWKYFMLKDNVDSDDDIDDSLNNLMGYLNGLKDDNPKNNHNLMINDGKVHIISKDRANLEAQISKHNLYPMNFANQQQGYYKNFGVGYLYGFTDDKQHLTITQDKPYQFNMNGIILTAPDESFAMSYNDNNRDNIMLLKPE